MNLTTGEARAAPDVSAMVPRSAIAKTVPNVERMANVRGPQYLSPDGRHIMVSTTALTLIPLATC